MRVIPVLDLMGGLVVRGIAGRRSEYRPIESPLVADARPTTVAAAFVALGLHSAYVADLDAIGGAAPDFDAYRAIREAGLDLWIDAGVGDAASAARFFSPQRAVAAAHDKLVVGLETLAGFDELAEIVAQLGPARLVFSLDMKQGQPLARVPELRGESPLALAERAVETGIRSMIVLDLARVGVGQGAGTEPLCRQISSRWPQLEIIAGGGVRGPDDLRRLQAAGCQGALVASALHDGALDRQSFL